MFWQVDAEPFSSVAIDAGTSVRFLPLALARVVFPYGKRAGAGEVAPVQRPRADREKCEQAKGKHENLAAEYIGVVGHQKGRGEREGGEREKEDGVDQQDRSCFHTIQTTYADDP